MSRGRALGPGRLVKQGRSWHLHWTDEFGKRQRRALSTDRRAAERIRAEIIRARDMALAGLGSEAGQDLTVAEVVRDYLADLEPRVSPRHYRNVSARLEKLLAKLDGIRVRNLKPMHVVRLRNEATVDGRANRSANLIVQGLQAALRWAEENAIIAANPIASVKPLPYSREHHRCRRRAMTEDEIRRFLAASEEDDEQCALIWDYERVPMTPFWITAIETGARYGELRQLVWGDVDLKRAVVTLRAETTKSKKQRAIPLRAELVERLRRLKMLHESVLGRLPMASDRVFLSAEGKPLPVPTTNPRRVFLRVLEAAGIPKVDARGGKLDLHALRTTAQSRMARNRVPLVQAQHILGHADPKLTATVYTDLAAEDLRAAVNSLPPIGGEAPGRTTKEAR